MRAVIGLFFFTLLASCAGTSSPAPAAPGAAAPQAAASAPACTHQLGPRSAARRAVQHGAAVPAPPSRLIVDAKLPLSTLTSELERNVAPRVAEGRGIKIGPAGVLHYSVDRGPFAVSIAGGHLVVETPLHGRAEACSGRRCYAACEPEALARAHIPLWLRPDYRFERSRVSLEFRRGCKVRALRGLFSVDVTPMLKSAVAPELERVRREIDRRLPDVRADVGRAWRQLSTPRALPLGGCLVIEPLGLVQGPIHESRGMAHARLALLARPELRTDCESAPVPSSAPPPLSADPALPEEDSVRLGMELPLTSLAQAFQSASVEARPGPRIHVSAAKVEARGERVGAELTLADELCGALVLEAQPVFDGDEGMIELTGGELDAAESERVRAAGLDPALLAQRLTRLPRLATPLSVPLLRLAPRALASLFSDPKFSLETRVSALRSAGAAARGANLVAWVEARGSLSLEQK